MSLTSSSAVVRRLVVSPGHAPPGTEPERLAATPAALSAVLRAFGRPLDRLPARTVVYIGGPADQLPALHEGFTIRTEPTAGRALRRASHELHDGTTDLAIVAGFAEPDPATITVHAVRRAAEAVADCERIVGLLDLSTGTADELPPVRPFFHGHRETGPERHRLLLWSGRDDQDESRVRGELLSLLDESHSEAFPALPTAVPCGTPAGPVRAATVTVSALARASVHKAPAAKTGPPRQVALLFPGQGSQHTGMATGLYGRDPVFTAAVDAVFAHMGDEGQRVREDWLSPGPPRIPVDDVRRAQPLLFAVDYALGKLVLSWGVRPAALLGHSAGELVAATLAGVVSLGDAVSMVMSRVRAAVEIPEGGMLAVAASEEQVAPYLTGEVVVAAVNAAQQVMLAGPAAPLAAVRSRLGEDGHTVVAVPASSPFHSPAMAPAAERIEADYRRIPLREPVLPLYSGYTGTLLSAQDALDPRFWARQVTDTVRFKDALEELLAIEDVLLIEAGPRQTLTAFARRHRAVRLGASAACALSPARAGTGEAQRQSVLAAAARIWTEGHDLDMHAVSGLWTWSADRQRTPQPELTGVPA
ncbi:acyltransferase domain-containing protein [Streptomyces sp. NPDC060006]|uniref:acyltransferase domain-containing protein n=1 Tax=unclassified Streptomyces TaxID=2593676 RepID=UPI0036BB84FC